MRVASALAGLTAVGVLLAGCGSEESPASEATASASPTAGDATASPPEVDGGGSIDLQGYASVEELADASPVVVLGTVASWEEGPIVDLGDERAPYAVLLVAVDQVVKDRDGVASGDTIAVPVSLEGEAVAAYAERAPEGSNVAFLGGADVGLSMFDGPKAAEVENPDAGSGDGSTLLWGDVQGVIVETGSGELANLDDYGRGALWAELVKVPAGEQFGMLAQRIMAARG
ncbi:hypothetical protein FE697_004510 [Mumia zhuanghuii]|uniref:Lipoprotein n=2 Tax=Mumia TaxID=1546255 RepID=A0ABW1QLX9_9ACTN|nr:MULTISPECIES: hypothetical protein [Mumia]KAA1425143.1 hypothetical protein FE697_004510 [Mumia zhuanghuii]